MRKPIVLTLAVLIAAFSLAVWLIGYDASSIQAHERRIGNIIPFGGYDWRVLDVQGSMALTITENVIKRRPYNAQQTGVTWETCPLREYLNGEFLQKFTREEQGRIAETRIQNHDNLWYGTKGGDDTNDKIFLLSLEEADKYFGNSGDYQNKRRKSYENGKWVSVDNGFAFSNANDSDRIANYSRQASWWWLRSPGRTIHNVSVVYDDGLVDVGGYGASFEHGGLRPALWLNL
ncbi:MAG: DUF6273 domain-containing protein [Synergistaceae bacterium]|nr:DUF6273 domain-containing protein [Synergistaceae bacterium]